VRCVMETKQKRTRSHRGKPGKEEKMDRDKEMQRTKMPPAPHPSPTLHSATTMIHTEAVPSDKIVILKKKKGDKIVKDLSARNPTLKMTYFEEACRARCNRVVPRRPRPRLGGQRDKMMHIHFAVRAFARHGIELRACLVCFC
jgi:hypothetical protein